MFKVKATVVAALGDLGNYPCHFNYKIGDEIIYDGAEIHGRVCLGVLATLAAKMANFCAAGPRWVEPMHYVPFWYSTTSPLDPEMKKYDGIGFRPLSYNLDEPHMSMTHLCPPGAFTWPPQRERTILSDCTFYCPDTRSSMVFKVEAFDLADNGDGVTYFRRQMVMMDRMSKHGPLSAAQILDLFSGWEKTDIYPIMTALMVDMLLEELLLLGYVEQQDGDFSVTPKALAKVRAFKDALTAEEKQALSMGD
jgi:uncharacterized repeat protein (TIGR04076 family)